MAQVHPLDLLREVLDHELVDANGTPCGIVDDIEFGDSPVGPVLAALWVGPGAWVPRLPALLALPARRLFGEGRVRVPWEQVQDIGEVIRLKASAGALGLGRNDQEVGRWLKRLPGA